MSYGLQILNTSGQLAFTDNAVTPWFAGKLTPGATLTSSYIFGNYRVWQLTYTFPAFVSGRTYMYATALPDGTSTDQWYSPLLTKPGYAGAGGGRRLAAPSATPIGSLVLPEVYAFCTSNPVATSETYGLRVYAANGVDLVFDAGNKPMMLVSMPSVGLAGVSVAVSNMPAKPAFFLYEYAGERSVRRGTTQQVDIYQIGGFFKRTGGYVIGSRFDYGSVYEDIGFVSTSTFGSTAAQPIPVINATNYD